MTKTQKSLAEEMAQRLRHKYPLLQVHGVSPAEFDSADAWIRVSYPDDDESEALIRNYAAKLSGEYLDKYHVLIIPISASPPIRKIWAIYQKQDLAVFEIKDRLRSLRNLPLQLAEKFTAGTRAVTIAKELLQREPCAVVLVLESKNDPKLAEPLVENAHRELSAVADASRFCVVPVPQDRFMPLGARAVTSASVPAAFQNYLQKLEQFCSTIALLNGTSANGHAGAHAN